MTSRKKMLTRGGVVGAALVAVTFVAAGAWACVSLASITLDPGKGAPGATVSGKLVNFGNNAPFSDISVRWGGPEGPVVATVAKPSPPTTNGQGSTSFTMTVPADVAPGTYAVTATQTDATGAPVWGTPARATFVVVGKIAGQAPGAGDPALSPENIAVTQQRITQANAARAPQQAQTAAAAPAPAARPAEVPSLEVQDSIDAKVSPSGSRTARFSPASSSSDSNSLPLQAGLGLAAVGAMALLTAVGATMILRSAQTASSRR